MNSMGSDRSAYYPVPPSLADYSCLPVTREGVHSAPERVENSITDASKKPFFDDEDAVFCFWFIFRFAGRAGMISVP